MHYATLGFIKIIGMFENRNLNKTILFWNYVGRFLTMFGVFNNLNAKLVSKYTYHK